MNTTQIEALRTRVAYLEDEIRRMNQIRNTAKPGDFGASDEFMQHIASLCEEACELKEGI